MANPSKAKGTGGETELLRRLHAHGWHRFRRTPPGRAWDLEDPGYTGPGAHNKPLELLVTRPDKGQWLVTLRLDDLLAMLDSGKGADDAMRIEVKRYKKFAIHNIFESKFGGKK